MTNGTQMAPYLQAVVNAETKFNKQSHAGLLVFEDEAGHACELLARSEMILKTAQQNPQSVRRAVVKVASIGLTLNPALAYAYLVPRDGMICLDISYKGLVKLATDSGAIKWAQAELVYESDTFKYRGLASEPLHEMDPFSKDRGQIIGAYCVAKTADGDFLSTMMSMDEIKEVQNTSKAKNGPWKKFFGEMAKKSVLKRAQKQWPKGTDNRLENAIHVINQHEGLEGKELNPDDYRLTGDLVEPFFDAFFNEKPLLMEEVANRCTDTQWVDLQNTFSRETKEVTKKKAKALELLRQGSALWTDIKAEYKELMQQDDDFGMLQIYGDLSVYWQSRLSDEIEGFETPPEVVNK